MLGKGGVVGELEGRVKGWQENAGEGSREAVCRGKVEACWWKCMLLGEEEPRLFCPRAE